MKKTILAIAVFLAFSIYLFSGFLFAQVQFPKGQTIDFRNMQTDSRLFSMRFIANKNIGDLLLGPFLKKVKDTATSILNDSSGVINNVIKDIAGQIFYRADELEKQLFRDLNRTIDSLDNKIKSLVFNLNTSINLFIDKINSIGHSITKEMVTDIRAALAGTILGSEFFAITDISDTLIACPYSSSPYYIFNILGVGFGFDTSKFKKSHILRVELPGANPVFIDINGTPIQSNKTSFSFKKEDFEPYRQRSEHCTIKAVLNSVIKKKTLLGWQIHKYSTPLIFTLESLLAGSLEVEISDKICGWVDSPSAYLSLTKYIPSGSPGNDSITRFDFESPYNDPTSIGQARITGLIRAGCSGHCEGWSRQEGPYYFNGGRSAYVIERRWGDPITVTWTAKRDVYKLLNYQRRKDNVDFYFDNDNTMRIIAPKSYKYIHVKVADTYGHTDYINLDRDDDSIIPTTPSIPIEYFLFQTVIDNGPSDTNYYYIFKYGR